ncbi:MAG TPA: transcriptional regulator [Holophaga sp.]|nr:transcriptional regulator [Holophaga sp.]
MKDAFQRLLELDRMVHEPARLAILTVLSSAETVEFKFMERVTRLTKGNLNSHATKLEAAGYLEVLKSFRGKTPVTTFRLTAEGRAALERYWREVRAIQP